MTSTRAEIITRRTYCRPLEDGTFENWEQVVDRVIQHQRWLWERALTHILLPGMPLKDVTGDMVEWVPLDKEQIDELEELRELMLTRKALPSGRTLWLGGTDIAKKRESSMFNCSHVAVETVYDVVDSFWLLLQGCGVGFTPRVGTLTGFRKQIKSIEVIRSEREGTDKGREDNEESFIDGIWYISVGDSAEAWAKALGKLLAGKYKAHTLVFDFSQIRGPGYRLKGYGWLSSGDESIAKAFPAIAAIMNKRAGSLLRKVDIVEILNHMGTVLSSRRSAEIALVDYGSDEWKEFAKLKTKCYEEGYKHRQQSNNSLVFQSTPTREEMIEIFDIMIAGGGSEPGFYNMETAKKRAPYAMGTNPCITGDTLITTEGGLEYAKDLVGVPFNAVIDGNYYHSEGFFHTGHKPVYKLETDKGYSLKATDNHKIQLHDDSWIKLIDLNIGDKIKIDTGISSKLILNDEFDKGWLLGEIVGDGGHNPDKYESYVRFWGDNRKELHIKSANIVNNLLGGFVSIDRKESNNCITCSSIHITELASDYLIPKTKRFKDTLLTENQSFIKGFISGFFDADGSVQGNLIKGVSIRLAQSDLQKLEDVQIMLSNLGIISTIYKNRRPAEDRMLPDGKGGNKLYSCKAQHELVISASSFSLFGKIIGFSDKNKQKAWLDIENSRKRKPNKDKKIATITNITDTKDSEDVFDCTVSGVHSYIANGIIVHNCGEILLSAKGFCNLVEIDVGKFKGDQAGQHNAATIISRANYRQTVVDLDDGILQESWNLNNQFLRLCGVGVTGIAKRDDMTEYDWKNLKYSAVTSARGMAKELGLEYPKNVTTVKPSGTLGKIMDTTEGVHKAEGKYLFNWINFSKHDPIVDRLLDANYNAMQNPSDSTGMLVCLPVRFDDVEFSKKEVTRADGSIEILEVNLETAIEQLERYKKIQLYYCDQNVSNTIYYNPEEKEDIVDWLLNNWDVYVGVSFLFKNDPTVSAKDLGFAYLPQEYVTKDAYNDYVKQLKEIDWSDTDSEEEIEDDGCASGACPIK